VIWISPIRLIYVHSKNDNVILYFAIKLKSPLLKQDKILKYLTIDLFVMTYLFIVASLICIFARVLILICIFCMACWYGYMYCDVPNITPCKFCVITSKYWYIINSNINTFILPFFLNKMWMTKIYYSLPMKVKV
jgi:hypothetical protein